MAYRTGVTSSFAVAIERIDESEGGRARALQTISRLRQEHTVYAAESGLWAVVMAPSRLAAIDWLRAELDEIDPGWSEALALS
jgi:hypothetical protein